MGIKEKISNTQIHNINKIVYKFLSHKTLCKLSKISLFTSFTFYEKTPFSSAMKGCFLIATMILVRLVRLV